MTEAKKMLIVYLDDNDQRKEGIFDVIEISTFVKFKTRDGNIICLPPSRVIKIKFRGCLK